MKIEFLDHFGRDLDKILDEKILESVSDVIETVENAKKLSEIPQIKKMKGAKNAYRIRVGIIVLASFLKIKHLNSLVSYTEKTSTKFFLNKPCLKI